MDRDSTSLMIPNGVTGSRKSKDRQFKFEDTKGVTRSNKSKTYNVSLKTPTWYSEAINQRTDNISLKTPTRYSEAVNQRTDNISLIYNGQKKRTNEQLMIYKTLHRKQRIEQHEPH